MSDIPPELMDEPKPAACPRCGSSDHLHRASVIDAWCEQCFWSSREERADLLFNRRFLIACCVALLLLCWASFSHAATFDASDTYCELFAEDPDNHRYYIVEDPPWTPACANPWVTVRTAKFQALVDAYEGSSGSSTTPQFTADEVTALKYQAANPSPFNLSIADGALVSVSIAGVWAVAWGFKQLGRFSDGHFGNES